MADPSFLAHFITEDIYVLKEEMTTVHEEATTENTPPKTPKSSETITTVEQSESEQATQDTKVAASEAKVEAQPVATPVEEVPTEPVIAAESRQSEAEQSENVAAAPVESESPALFEPLKAEEPEPVYLKPLPTLGKNLKHCLVLVESDARVLENDLKGLLGKIMTAVNRTGEDILLVNVKEASEDQVEALLSEQNHRHLLAFGTEKVQGLSEVGNYELVDMNRKAYLKADSLRAISEQLDLKKALWKALKDMF